MANFSEDTIQKVWTKAKIVPGNDSNVWRKDQCDAWIGRKFYGGREDSHDLAERRAAHGSHRSHG